MTAAISDPVDLQHGYADVIGARLRYVRAGNGPLIIFLHGFPQGWFIWRRQLAAFAADNTVVAVDLRGFGMSSTPEHPWEYGSWTCAEDIRQLAEQLGFETFTLVGHDTGGTVGYSFALHHPEMLDRLAILSTAHPALFDRELHHNPKQIAASQYLLFLRRPEAAAALAESDFARLRATFADHPYFTDADLLEHVAAWRQPGGATGMLGWYRREALGPRDQGTPARGNFVPEVSPLVIQTPALVMVGENDEFIRPHCFDGLEQYMPNATLIHLPGASHWLCQEHPDIINRHLRDLITRS